MEQRRLDASRTLRGVSGAFRLQRKAPRVVVGLAGVMLLLGLEPEGPHLTERAEARTTPVALGAASAVVLSGQARRFLALQFKIVFSSLLLRDVGEHPAELAWSSLSIDM